MYLFYLSCFFRFKIQVQKKEKKKIIIIPVYVSCSEMGVVVRGDVDNQAVKYRRRVHLPFYGGKRGKKMWGWTVKIRSSKTLGQTGRRRWVLPPVWLQLVNCLRTPFFFYLLFLYFHFFTFTSLPRVKCDSNDIKYLKRSERLCLWRRFGPCSAAMMTDLELIVLLC